MTTLVYTATVLLPLLFAPVIIGAEAENAQAWEWLPEHTPIKFSVHCDHIGCDLAELDEMAVPGSDIWLTVKGYDCHAPALAEWAGWRAAVVELLEYAERGGYAVRWVEIWNEPDALTDEYASYFGCWGPTAEAGRLYSAFVQYVSANLNYIIAAGALQNPSSDFAANVIGGDVLSFHCYAPADCQGYLAQATRLAHDRPVALSETGVISGDRLAHWAWLTNQHDLEAVFWYTLAVNGWPADDPSDLVQFCEPWFGAECAPTPVYYEFMFYNAGAR